MYHVTDTKRAQQACEFLNNHVHFDDFTNVSEFRIDNENTLIYVRGPSNFQKRCRGRCASSAVNRMSPEEFEKRLAPYVDSIHISYESHKNGVYYILKQSGIQQVIDYGQ
jgi:ribosomal protein L31E